PLAERQAKRSGHLGAEYNLALGIAVRRWAGSGDLESLVTACRAIPERFPDIRFAVLFGRIFLAFSEFYRGNWTEALNLIEDVAREFPVGGWEGMPRSMAILFATYAGRPPAQSLEALERDLPDGLPAILGRWVGMLHVLEVYALSDRRHEA